MKSYVQGTITDESIVFSGQTNFDLSKKDEKLYKSKGWVRALYELEMNLGYRIDSLSRLFY
tara:strand:+ start:540 stop:722 length:183 start_codon:yes stop_codon:yes gene_type:complete